MPVLLYLSCGFIAFVLCDETIKDGMFAGRHSYNVEGSVKLIKGTDGKHRLEYTGYIQIQGPAVYQYLCEASDPTSLTGCTGRLPVPAPPAEGADEPRIGAASGIAFTIQLADNFDPTGYKSVTAWCDFASRPFGVAMLADATVTACTAATDCNGKGICVDTNDRTKGCACQWGSYGAMCQGTCPGGLNTPCNNNGVCMSTGFCRCNNGFNGDACETPGYVVGVMAKSANNPQPQGFTEAYTLSGTETPEIILVRDTRYTFVVSATGHPLYISTSEVGAGSGEVTVGVINSRAQQDSTLGFTPNSQHGDLLYYQCFLHQRMGWKINLVNAKSCASSCTLPNGVCDAATGNCRCVGGWSGNDCVTCDTTVWDNGDGKCNTCKLPRYLVAGKCVECKPGFFGTGCTSQCPQGNGMTCSGFGYCDEGPSGSGSCTCDSNHQGNTCSAAVVPPPADIVFNLATKMNGAHPKFGQGSPNGYTVKISNEELSPSTAIFQGQELVLRCYIRYSLQVDGPCSDPMIITTSDKGGSTTGIVEDQVTGNMACEGSRIQITPHIGLSQTLYYQSATNEYVGNKITLLLPGSCPPQGCGDNGDCDNTSGECTCKNNWKGLLCEIDPDGAAATDDSTLQVPATPSSAESPPSGSSIQAPATDVIGDADGSSRLEHNLLGFIFCTMFSAFLVTLP